MAGEVFERAPKNDHQMAIEGLKWNESLYNKPEFQAHLKEVTAKLHQSEGAQMGQDATSMFYLNISDHPANPKDSTSWKKIKKDISSRGPDFPIGLTAFCGRTIDETSAFAAKMTGFNTQSRKGFKTEYDAAMTKFKASADLQEKYKTADTFIIKEGEASIDIRQAEIISVYVKRFAAEQGIKPENQLTESVLDFIDDSKNLQALQNYSKLDTTAKNDLFWAFSQRCGLSDLPKEKVTELLENIATSIQMASISRAKWMYAYNEMVAAKDDESITDEQWEKMVEEKAQKNAQTAYQTQNKETSGQVISLGNVQDTTPNLNITSASDAARQAGAESMRYDASNGHYVLTLPGKVEVEMSIKREGEETKFTFYDKNSDKGEITVSASNLRETGNRITLDKKTTARCLQLLPGTTNYNQLLPDNYVKIICEGLFKVPFNSMGINPEKMHVYEKFIDIVLSDDKKDEQLGFGDLSNPAIRVKVALNAVSEGQYGTEIIKQLSDQTVALQENQKSGKNLTTLLKAINYKPSGVVT